MRDQLGRDAELHQCGQRITAIGMGQLGLGGTRRTQAGAPLDLIGLVIGGAGKGCRGAPCAFDIGDRRGPLPARHEEVDLPGFGRVEIPAANISRANPDDEGPTVGFRPEAVSIVSTGAPTQSRVTEGTIDEVVYYGDMTYYDVRLDGSDGFGAKVRPIRIAMRNVFGREVQEVGARANVSWSPGSLVLFR